MCIGRGGVVAQRSDTSGEVWKARRMHIQESRRKGERYTCMCVRVRHRSHRNNKNSRVEII